jgi:hypothetical protein
MTDLKDYIKNNREIFDDKEPSAGHAERFEALLNKQQPLQADTDKVSKKRIPFIKLISVAASIAILVVVGIQFYHPNQITPSGSSIENKGNTTDEFASTNDYYQQQMEAQIADIMCKLADTDRENQAQLSSDIERIVNSNKAFVKEIANSDNKELALYYLVRHYKANIQVLENINEKLGKHTKC